MGLYVTCYKAKLLSLSNTLIFTGRLSVSTFQDQRVVFIVSVFSSWQLSKNLPLDVKQQTCNPSFDYKRIFDIFFFCPKGFIHFSIGMFLFVISCVFIYRISIGFRRFCIYTCKHLNNLFRASIIYLWNGTTLLQITHAQKSCSNVNMLKSIQYQLKLVENTDSGCNGRFSLIISILIFPLTVWNNLMELW